MGELTEKDKAIVATIPNWRKKNIEKAREARRKKLLDEHSKELEKKIECLSKDVDKKINASLEGAVKDKVNELVSDLKGASNLVKAAFFAAFEKSGGMDSLVTWIKEKDYNQKEFYKMLISLLKSESNKGDSGNKQAVIVNIVGLNKKQDLRVEVDGERVDS